MESKVVYQTNELGLYSGTAQADPCPIEKGVWLIPGGCVEVPPPEIPEHKAAHWNGKAWSLVNYYQGLVVYSITTGEPLTVTGMGPIPAGYTTSQPGPDQVWKNGAWVDDTAAVLAKLHLQKLEEINAGCSAYIESGFSSAALGESYRYGSTLTDQVNLTGLGSSGLDSAYPCTGADGVRQFRAHTREQLHQVNQDMVVFRQAALQHADGLKRELDQALVGKKLKVMRGIKWTVPA